MNMNRDKHLNEVYKKRKTRLNDSACHTGVDNHAVGSRRPTSSVADVNSTQLMVRPHCQHQIPELSGCGGHCSARLNSDRLNAETDRVSDRDLLRFRLGQTGASAGAGANAELFQGRIVSNNDGYQRYEHFSNKKKKSYSPNFGWTITPSIVVSESTEDGAAGFVDGQIRSIDHSTGSRDHISMQQSQRSASKNEPYSSADHLVAHTPTAASLLTSGKVLCLNVLLLGLDFGA